MKLPFFKYQALGNDFVIFDCRKLQFKLSIKNIKHICDRKIGIGCDQLMTIHKSKMADVKIKIYNQDGSLAKICGNGVRAIALYLGFKESKIETDSGIIKCKVMSKGSVGCYIPIKSYIEVSSRVSVVNVGNLHKVQIVRNIKKIKTPRINNKYNLEFIEIKNNKIFARVFERGVGETKACGTGAVAIALRGSNYKNGNYEVHFAGGNAQILLELVKNQAFLKSKVEFVFSGNYYL